MKMNRTLMLTLLSFTAAGLALAQDQAPPPPDASQSPAPNGGWRRVDQAPPNQPAEDGPRTTMDPNYAQDQPPAPPPEQGYPNQGTPNQRYPNQGYPHPGDYRSQPAYNPGPIPSHLTIKPGTYVTVRLNQGLSSDRNRAGDGFSATLARPVVVDGWVIANAGQTVGGRVVEAKKAGRVEGVSHLGVQLTDLTLADGNPAPVQTQLVTRNGRTSEGRDAAAIAGTTGLGAAIGAGVDWGRGAAIGAGAGAAVGIIGVLLTRGHPTVLYPESVLTFRVEQPVTISTEAAPQAFHYVRPDEYARGDLQTRMRRPGPRPYAGYGPYYQAVPYPYPYYYGAPYYWGPAVGFYWGPRFYGRWGYWGRGWRR